MLKSSLFLYLAWLLSHKIMLSAHRGRNTILDGAHYLLSADKAHCAGHAWSLVWQ